MVPARAPSFQFNALRELRKASRPAKPASGPISARIEQSEKAS